MHFHKQDLAGEHYQWEEENDRLFSGEPTRRLFNRYNGNQVLFIINAYASSADNFTTEEGRVIEEQLINKLPIDNKSEISVYNWIKDLALTKLDTES